MLRSHRKNVADFMRRLYERGLTTVSGGNISVRADDKRIVLTPSQTDKSTMTEEDVGVLSPDGTNLTPSLRPSIESELHLGIYRNHPRIHAIVHAHPVTATAFSATDRRINTHLVCESYAITGEPVTVPYACMGTRELADSVIRATETAEAVIMQNHGVLTTGSTLLEAFNRLEVLEAAAKQTLITQFLGTEQPLQENELSALDALAGRSANHRQA